jgi:hypothetical protein
MTTQTDRIRPTKESPIFIATCDYFGRIEAGPYKDFEVGDCRGRTFGTNYAKAVNDLHEWIKENSWAVCEYPKCKFTIEMVDGSIEHDQYASQVVYTISAAKAKKFLL